MSQKIINNTIVIKPKALNAKQLFLLTKMTNDEKMSFLLSMSGMRSSIRNQLSNLKMSHLSPIRSDKKSPVVHTQPNHFLELLKRQFTLGTKIPILKDAYYGIEIECLIPFKSLGLYKSDYQSGGSGECSSCEGSGILIYTHRDTGHDIEHECPDCEGSGDHTNNEETDLDRAIDDARQFLNEKVKELKIKGLNAVHDGSIDTDGDHNMLPIEITLLVKKNDLSDLKKTCDLLNSLSAVVNASCGLHVHLDARDKTKGQVERIGKRFEKTLRYLGEMVPVSRRKNRYCKMVVSGITGDRYSAVNLTAFQKHNTIEVRLHSATTSFEKIAYWLRIVSAVAETSNSQPIRGWKSFFELIKADDTMKNYIKERVEKFKGSIEESELTDEPCSSDFEQLSA